MPKLRTFAGAPPNGWISRERLLVETGIGERKLAGWVAQLGLKTCLVSRGRGGFEFVLPFREHRHVQASSGTQYRLATQFR